MEVLEVCASGAVSVSMRGGDCVSECMRRFVYVAGKGRWEPALERGEL